MAIKIFAMFNKIKCMFGGVKPFDWLMLIVEILVLALIAFEIFHSIWHRRKIVRLLSRAFYFVQMGQKLQVMIGPEWNGPPLGPEWIKSVKAWNQETLNFLEACSPQARESFLINNVEAHREQSLKVPPEAQWWYRTMLNRLDNLQRIAENPDVYF
jgi:hypothetical protein